MIAHTMVFQIMVAEASISPVWDFTVRRNREKQVSSDCKEDN